MEYTLEEVRRKVINTLSKEETGLSGVELAKKTGINRITLTKYLKILETMSVVKRKSVGISNIWYLDQAAVDTLNADMIDIRRYYIDAIINQKDIKSILSNALYMIDPIRLLVEIIIPSRDTIRELYNRGSITSTELMVINNTILESIIFIKLNAVRSSIKKGASCIILDTVSNDNMSKMLDAIFYIQGWNTLFIGWRPQTDPLFDIEFIRFINKIWREDLLILMGIYADKVESIQIIKEMVDSVRAKMHRVYMFVYGIEMEHDEYDLYTKDLSTLVRWCESLYNGFRS